MGSGCPSEAEDIGQPVDTTGGSSVGGENWYDAGAGCLPLPEPGAASAVADSSAITGSWAEGSVAMTDSELAHGATL